MELLEGSRDSVLPESSSSWNQQLSQGHLDLSCLICGGKSTGVHYGVTSCEGCKAFFKRGVAKNVKYTCYFGGACIIGPKTRGWCKSCRFQKCFQVGMSLDVNRVRQCKKSDNGGQKREAESSIEVARKKPRGTASPEIEESRNTDVNAGSGANAIVFASGSFGKWEAAQKYSVDSRPVRSHETDDSMLDVPQAALVNNGLCMERWTTSSVDKSLAVNPYRSLAHVTQENVYPLHHLLLNSIKLLDNPVKDTRFWTKIEVENSPQEPSQFVRKYWSVMNERNTCLETTIRAVADSVEVAYRDQIELFSYFMEHSAEKVSSDPHPELPYDKTMDIFWEKSGDDVVRSTKFASLLPGFDELDQTEKISRVCNAGLETWMVHHARFVRNGELYCLTKQHHYHYSRRLMDTLFDTDFVDFIFSFMEQINSLQLTLIEIYVLLAVVLLRPDNSLTENPTSITFLYAHYLDAFVYLLSTRKAPILHDLEAIIGSFKSIRLLQRRYVLAIDVTRTPFTPCSGLSFMAVKDSLPKD